MSRLLSQRRRLALAGFAAAALLAVSACSAAVQQSSSSTPQGSGSAPSAAPQSGGTLTVAQAWDAQPNGFLQTNVGNIVSEYAVFETLTRIENGKPVGVLAKSWTLASDLKSMDITLRDGVTFHSGDPLTADAVIYTLKKAQDPTTAAANSQIATAISGITKVSPTELKLTFSRALPNIFDLFETMPIVNPANYAQQAAGKVIDGSGPFTWTSWTPGGQIVLTKYPKYRDAAQIHLDKIVVKIITDPTAEAAAMRSGSADFELGLSSLDAIALSKQPGYQLISAAAGDAMPLGFDVTQAPFNNKLVRQAAQYAIDRQRIIDQVESGQGTATSLPWRADTVGYDKQQADTYTYNPDKAKELLKQAGVSDVSFKLVTINSPETTGIAQIVKNNLDAVGLHATIEPISATDYDGRIAAAKMGAPVFLMSGSNALSPGSAVLGRAELKASGNPSHFSTPEYTKLVDELSTAATEQTQTQALHEWNAYFLDQAFAVPLIVRPPSRVATSQVHGIAFTQMGFADVTRAWLSK